jgi:hypothetical protein
MELELPRRGGEDQEQTDRAVFDRLTSVDLSDEEKALAVRPDQIAAQETRLLAVHFHPEWVPLTLIEDRLKTAFPAAQDALVVPTQHNRVMTLGAWSGVEADVYAPAYGLKIQLLIHFPSSRLPKAGPFQAMMERTFRYRACQLLEILEALVRPGETLAREIKKNGFSSQAVRLAASFAKRVEDLIRRENVLEGPRSEMIKNRLLPDFMQARGQLIDAALMDRALALVRLVKASVKRRLDSSRFHEAREVIEEARSLGAGVVIPHPPQFWPALLDDLDVDGWEVWNPSTPAHTLFLLECLARGDGRRRRPLLAFMGDDTHMSSKIRPDLSDDKPGVPREIGFQPPWRDSAEALARAGQSRERTMDEYRARLA